MTVGDAGSPLARAVLDARLAALSSELETVAPGLLAEHPVATSTALLRVGRERGYARLGAYAWVAETIERRSGPEALELYHRLLLLAVIRDRQARGITLVVPVSVTSLVEAELRRIVAGIDELRPGFYRLDNDLFLKDLGLARGILLPVGAELVETASGVPKRVLVTGGLWQLLRGLYFFVVKTRGFAPFLELHMDPRTLGEFTPAGWDATYRRVADLLRLNPRVRGLFGSAWFYDPAMERVSPHLSYIRRRREQGGAWTFQGGTDASVVRDALARSAARRRHHEAGRYQPRSHYPVWARRDLIRWADGEQHRDTHVPRWRSLKIVALRVMKSLGLFRLARRATGDGLRILGYHGIALADEHRFQSQLYMTPWTFRERLELLRRLDVPILPLHEAVERLARRTLPPCATVITIDDGWYGTYVHGLPLLEALGWPATLYVTSYYAQKQTPVFNVAVAYLFWKTHVTRLDLSAVDPRLAGSHDLVDPAAREAAMDAIVAHGDAALDAGGRQRLLRALAGALAVDFGPIEERRLFRLLSLDELRDAAKRGIDVQLHTHRHSLFGLERQDVLKEIEDNRAALAPVVDRDLVHLCYPSGVYSPRAFPWLETAGIRSATTCEPRFNYPATSPFALGRFLDGENITPIEFEAEICGVLELLRRGRAVFRREG